MDPGSHLDERGRPAHSNNNHSSSSNNNNQLTSNIRVIVIIIMINKSTTTNVITRFSLLLTRFFIFHLNYPLIRGYGIENFNLKEQGKTERL
jgi:hypothetical protein